jgi:hypothetical protein
VVEHRQLGLREPELRVIATALFRHN